MISVILIVIVMLIAGLLGYPHMLLLSIILIVVMWIIMKHHAIATPLLFALLIRLFIVFLIHQEILPEGDWDGYTIRALAWSQDGISGAFQHFTTGAYFYSWLASLVFSVFGQSLTLFRIMNAFISTLIVFLVYLIALRLSRQRDAIVAAWIMALFPSAIRYSAYFCNREPMIVFFFISALYFFLCWIDNMKYRDLILFLTLYSLTVILHSGFIVGMAVLLPYIMIRIIKYKKSYFGLFLNFLIFGTVCFLIYTVFNGGYLDKINLGGDTILQKINWYADVSSTGRARYLPGLVADQYYDILWQAPLRLVYFLLSPLPWMIAMSQDVLGLFDALFYYAIILSFIFFLPHLRRNPKVVIILLITLVITLVFAFATGNYGTAIRHRAKFFPVYLSLLAPGLILLWERFRSFLDIAGSWRDNAGI